MYGSVSELPYSMHIHHNMVSIFTLYTGAT